MPPDCPPLPGHTGVPWNLVSTDPLSPLFLPSQFNQYQTTPSLLLSKRKFSPLFANLAGPQRQWQWGPTHQVWNITAVEKSGHDTVNPAISGYFPKNIQKLPHCLPRKKKSKVTVFNTISISLCFKHSLEPQTVHPALPSHLCPPRATYN